MDDVKTDLTIEQLALRKLVPVTEVEMSAEEVAAILDRRARALAEVADADDGQEETVQYITFCLGKEHYAVEVGYVQETQPLRDLTLIPCTPGFIVGAVNIRGHIIAVIDLKTFFGIPADVGRAQAKVIVARNDDLEVGLLADQVSEVTSVSVDGVDQPLATLSGVREEYIKGVTKDGLIIIDINAILADKRMIINEEVI